MSRRLWRVMAGWLILGLMAAVGALLLPVYYRNLKFHSALEAMAARPDSPKQSDDTLRAAVVRNAVEFRLPVRPDQVSLARSADRVRIDVRYGVPVDLSIYSVELHFHPTAGN